MRAILSEEKDNEIAKLYSNNLLSSHQIAVIFNVSNATIIRSLRRSGVAMRKKTSVHIHSAWDRVDDVIADYTGGVLTFDEIKKKYNVSHLTIWRITDSRGIPKREHQVTSKAGRAICRENGLKRNKYPVNSTFFDCIDSEEKAYWWGFLYADGYVGRDARALIVGLCSKDHEHLANLRDLISATRPVRKSEKYRADLGIVVCASILRVDDQHLCERLRYLGMIPRRPEYERVKDNLPEQLFCHWLRGYIDGDGNAQKDNPTVRLLGQEDLLQWIVGKLNSLGIINTATIPRQKTGPNKTKCNIFELIIGGSHQMVSFRNWLYKDATVYLERKKEIMDTWKIKR
jgi:hypothetical protein